MNNTDPPASEQASKPPEHFHETAGMMLRKGRESANLTHAAVGEVLHLTVHYIKALENDDYKKLPGATFVKGYIRAYSRFLQLDANEVLASYEKNNVSAGELNNKTESLSRNQRRHDQTFLWAVVAALIIIAGVAAGWWFVGKDQVPDRAATTTPQLPAEPQASRTAPSLASAAGVAAVIDTNVTDSTSLSVAESASAGNVQLAEQNLNTVSEAAPIAAETDPAANNPAAVLTATPDQDNVAVTITPTADGAKQVTLISAGADVIQLYFKGSSWVEIDDGAKGRLYNETLNTGDAMTLHGTAPFTVLLGDAAQVELTYNSMPVNLSSQIRTDSTARFSLGAAAIQSPDTTPSGVNP